VEGEQPDRDRSPDHLERQHGAGTRLVNAESRADWSSKVSLRLSM
jgi:hypothetical protein